MSAHNRDGIQPDRGLADPVSAAYRFSSNRVFLSRRVLLILVGLHHRDFVSWLPRSLAHGRCRVRRKPLLGGCRSRRVESCQNRNMANHCDVTPDLLSLPHLDPVLSRWKSYCEEDSQGRSHTAKQMAPLCLRSISGIPLIPLLREAGPLPRRPRPRPHTAPIFTLQLGAEHVRY